ncbi:uncharacterized protein LOC143572235 [Bidens hawaiensis]|uniref:uncharacterized protein LOC143572235 n=1 Tax=Bidens hawaiensis TaxID=980011 RepID=UPI00404B62A2
MTIFLKDTTLNSKDRPDILCRLFKIKRDALLKDLKDKAVLGKVQAVVYTIEFQKRGLPHAHMCLFMHADHKLPDVENVDPFISAEIPDKNEDPELHYLASSIKYLFKYINKGPDRATVFFFKKNETQANVEQPEVDEIKQFYDFRYLSASEAAWRIFGYDVYYRMPSITRLPFHLPGQQHVVYGADDDLDNVLEKVESVSSSMFTGWMKCNEKYASARKLTYVELPTEFVWHAQPRRWEQRKSGFSVGRIHAVSPAAGEAYFLRILLNRVKGPQSFEDVRTVNGRLQPSFRDACYSLGLLEDDQEYIEAIEEASHSSLGHGVRALFATMLSTDSLSRPEHVWINTWKWLSDDILYNQRRLLKSPELSLTEDQIKNLTLFEIEKILLRNNSSLRKYQTMPFLDAEYISIASNSLIQEELAYDQNLQKLEKTYLWKTLSTALRSKGEIVLTVASSGIASLLLTGGRTAHSRSHIPINLNEDSTCYMDPGTDESQLLEKTKLIIWDEAPMHHKHGFQALDRSLKDVLSSNLLFGGKVVVFGGDFRQILPVVQKGTRQDIVNASLCSSYIWSECNVLKLTKNLRLTMGTPSSDVEETRLFAKWILDIGEGTIGGPNDGVATIDIPDNILIKDSVDPISKLFDFVYPDILQNYENQHYFQDRSILAPTNEIVDEINDSLLKFFQVMKSTLYSPELLNGLRISGLPNHKLVLKVGVPVMLLRNLNQKEDMEEEDQPKYAFAKKHNMCAILQVTPDNEPVAPTITWMARSNEDLKYLFHVQKAKWEKALGECENPRYYADGSFVPAGLSRTPGVEKMLLLLKMQEQMLLSLPTFQLKW